jgi:hypothetical protein
MMYRIEIKVVRGTSMPREDAVIVASRTLALLLAVGAFQEASYLPETLQSFTRYNRVELGASTASDYWRHSYLIRLGFQVTRLVAFSLMARWLYKGGSDVEEMFFKAESSQKPLHN